MGEVQTISTYWVTEPLASPDPFRGGVVVDIRRNGDEITVLCSPVSCISFLSNAVWAPERGHRGTGLTKAVCHVQPWEKFIRAEVTDEQGRKAWSKVIRL